MTGSPTTLGIDLASQATNTALCAIEWSQDAATVVALCKRHDEGGALLGDELLVAAMRGRWGDLARPTKVAIDAPLGWPVDFVRAVNNSASWPADNRRLVRRATDYWVHEVAGKLPLSVTTDRIAYAAMRAAGLLATLDEPVDRSGTTGRICEAYPDPAIRRLGLWPDDVGRRDSYKGEARSLRASIVGRLLQAAPWLHVAPEHQEACAESHDCLDALICALVARAAERGLTMPPPSELEAEARSEGWIHLPREDFKFAALL